MKLFALIFSVYLLLLTGIPCCLIEHCEDECQTTAVNLDHNKAPVKEKGCSNCSPFFSCHSCCGFIVQEKLSVTEIPAEYLNKVFACYVHPSYPLYSSSIWQPPQLA